MNGMPWSGPRICPASRSASRMDAILRKSGLSSSIALRSLGSAMYNPSDLERMKNGYGSDFSMVVSRKRKNKEQDLND